MTDSENDGSSNPPIESSYEAERVYEMRPGGDVASKRASWHAAVAEATEPQEFRTPDWEAFSATIRTRPIGSTHMALIDSGPWKALTTAEHASRPRAGQMFVTLCLAGEVEFNQEGETIIQRTGDCVIVDSQRVNYTASNEAARLLTLRIDRTDLAHSLIASVRHQPSVLRFETPTAAVAAHLMRRTWRKLPTLDDRGQAVLLDQIVRLMNEGLADQSSFDGPTSHQAAMINRAKAITLKRYGDPEFGPDILAKAMGVTGRYLNTLFRTSEISPGEFIQKIRLEEARTLLTDARCRASIEAIAHRTGFRSPSAFAQAVKKEFAATPTSLRAVGKNRLA